MTGTYETACGVLGCASQVDVVHLCHVIEHGLQLLGRGLAGCRRFLRGVSCRGGGGLWGVVIRVRLHGEG